MARSILSEFNYKRCTNPVILEIIRDVPIAFNVNSMTFCPHRAILCDNDEKQEIWKIKGIWNNNKIDTIIMGSGNKFINRYFDGNWFSYYFSEYQNKFFKQKLKRTADIKFKAQLWYDAMLNGPVYYLPNVRKIIHNSVNFTIHQQNIILSTLKKIIVWNKTFIDESICSDCIKCTNLRNCTRALQRYVQQIIKRV